MRKVLKGLIIGCLLIPLFAAAAPSVNGVVGETVGGVVLGAIAACGALVGFPIYFTYKKIRHASHIVNVWFGTNRNYNVLSGNFDDRFSEKISYGICSVSIPKSHKFGSIGSSAFTRFFQRIFAGTDDKLTVKEVLKHNENEFMREFREFAENFKADQKSVLVYIHGFNVDFDEAAIRAAQIGFDLKVPGPMAFYSWPSKGRMDPVGYAADKDTIAASEECIANFLLNVSISANGLPVHILAHSMGNAGLLRALNSAVARAETYAGVKFGQIFLAAPDVDARLFRQLSGIYKTLASRTTLYVSSSDVALKASEAFSETNRVGHGPPFVVVDGIDTIEVADIDLELLGHGYFASAAPVLYDIAQQIREDREPQLRPRLEQRVNLDGKPYWAFRA